MPEPRTAAVLATHAVALIAPHLTEAGKGAAKKLGETAGRGAVALWDPIRGRLTGVGADAKVQKFEAALNDPRRQTILAGELEEVLESDPGFAAEVQRLVAGLQPRVGVSLSAHVVGDNNIVGTNHGRGNSMFIGHGRAT